MTVVVEKSLSQLQILEGIQDKYGSARRLFDGFQRLNDGF